MPVMNGKSNKKRNIDYYQYQIKPENAAPERTFCPCPVRQLYHQLRHQYRQEDAQKWNAAHPDKQVTIGEDGKYQTKVKTRTGIYTVKADSFAELQKAAEARVNRENTRQFNTGMSSYTQLGSYMQTH